MEVSYEEVYFMNPEEARRKLVETYLLTGSISETARRWYTSRNVVRKWVSRYRERGLEGFHDLSRRPHHSPRRTPEHIEREVIKAKKATNFGRRRLAWYLRRRGIELSSYTIRNILRRYGYRGKGKRRKVFYPARWAFEEEEPFTLAQVDVKDILDKHTLGKGRWDHIRKCGLPRYQWTFCEAKTRLRFIAYSRELSLANGLAFLWVVMMWIRGHGIDKELVWQTDWGEEFGGTNPEKLEYLNRRYYEPLGCRLGRIPKGRKGYNGRVERSHRTDDEEFYIPCLLEIEDEAALLRRAWSWVYVYNVVRPHYGAGMEGKSPWDRLKELGYNLDESFAMLPPIILDEISTDLLTEGGNDVPAPCKGYPPSSSSRV